MSTKVDGGYAFPHPGTRTEDGTDFHTYPELGMTLRDYFAAQALVGILAFPGTLNGNRDKSASVCAVGAYEYADAMLAERGE
jgi:hypothetical protein